MGEGAGRGLRFPDNPGLEFKAIVSCWELNRSPLQEQQTLLTTESPLQPLRPWVRASCSPGWPDIWCMRLGIDYWPFCSSFPCRDCRHGAAAFLGMAYSFDSPHGCPLRTQWVLFLCPGSSRTWAQGHSRSLFHKLTGTLLGIVLSLWLYTENWHYDMRLWAILSLAMCDSLYQASLPERMPWETKRTNWDWCTRTLQFSCCFYHFNAKSFKCSFPLLSSSLSSFLLPFFLLSFPPPLTLLPLFWDRA